MITYSGIGIFPNTHTAPTISDIAIAQGRLPRFVGATQQWWPVLGHSFLVYAIVHEKGMSLETQRYALLHDGHEAVFGDIPSTWKTSTLAHHGRRLDTLLYQSLGIARPSASVIMEVHHADKAALLAEAATVGNAALRQHFSKEPASSPLALELARHYANRCLDPRDTCLAMNSSLVREYCLLTESLCPTAPVSSRHFGLSAGGL